MEIDNFLHKVQGFMKHEQKTLGNLDSIRRGNETEISTVVGGLLKIIQQTGNISLQLNQKLYLLMFLNTDMDIYNDLKKNRNFAHLVGFLPKLSSDLFMHIVIGLQQHELIFESVKEFPTPLAFKVLQLCLTSLEWMDLFQAISFVETLLGSLFRKILTVEESDEFSPHMKDVFQRLLLHFDAEKGGCLKRMSSWNKSKLKHYAGLVMTSLLSLVENCTIAYFRKEEEPEESNKGIFNIKFDQSVIFPIEHLDDRLSSIQHCYDYVIAKCHENVNSITVDIWLFWVEVDLDDTPDTENTLQRLVGEKAYSCKEALIAAESKISLPKEAADLVSKLKNFAMKPKPEEKTEPLEVEDILKNIQDPTKDNVKWIKYLVNNDFVLEPEALRVLLGSFNLIKAKDLNQILETVLDYIRTYPNSPVQKEFILSAVKLLKSESQVAFCEMFVERFGASKILKTEEFQTVLVESFNKVINGEDKEEEVYREFLWLAAQSGEEVVMQAVKEGVTSEVRGHLVADILSRLQPFCDTLSLSGSGRPILEQALDHLLHHLLPHLPESHRTNYPLFVRELVMRGNLDGEQFLQHSVLGKLHNQKDFIILVVCLETIQELYNVECTHYDLCTLAMLVFVLDRCRWSPSTFNSAAVQVCELTQQLMSQFISRCLQQQETPLSPETVTSLNNIKDLILQQTRPLNLSHLHKLIPLKVLPEGDSALQLLYRMHYGVGEWSVLNLTPEGRVQLVYSLCFVIPLLTSTEWQELFCVVAPKCSEFMELFDIVTDSLLLCIDSAKLKNDQKVFNCLTFTLSNISQAAKYELNRWTKDDIEYRIRVLVKLCTVLSHLPTVLQESQGLRMLNVLTVLLPEGTRRRPLTHAEMTSVTATLSTLQAASVRSTLSKHFLERVHR